MVLNFSSCCLIYVIAPLHFNGFSMSTSGFSMYWLLVTGSVIYWDYLQRGNETCDQSSRRGLPKLNPGPNHKSIAFSPGIFRTNCPTIPSSVPSITLPVGDSLWWRRDKYCGGWYSANICPASVSSRSLAASPLRQLHCVLKLLAGKIFFEELTFPFRSVTWPRGGRTRRGRSWRGRRTRWTSCARRSPRTRTSWTWRRWGRGCWYRGSSFCHSS